MKLIYLASPFFTPTQLATITAVEATIKAAGLALYSPRNDGVLTQMTPEERQRSASKIFRLNCSNIIHAEGVVAVLDEKDTGTTWELGFAYYHRRYFSGRFRIFAYTSTEVKMNVMLAQCFDAHAVGLDQLKYVLELFAAGTEAQKPEATTEVY